MSSHHILVDSGIVVGFVELVAKWFVIYTLFHFRRHLGFKLLEAVILNNVLRTFNRLVKRKFWYLILLIIQCMCRRSKKTYTSMIAHSFSYVICGERPFLSSIIFFFLFFWGGGEGGIFLKKESKILFSS